MWHAYSMEPIDHGWRCLSTIEAFLETLAIEEAHAKFRNSVSENETVDYFLADYREAKSAACEQGWEGEVQGEAYVFWLPVPGSGAFKYGFAWKQNTNGVTFIVSPVRLPWLENRSYGE
jgi:hypothetical protein